MRAYMSFDAQVWLSQFETSETADYPQTVYSVLESHPYIYKLQDAQEKLKEMMSPKIQAARSALYFLTGLRVDVQSVMLRKRDSNSSATLDLVRGPDPGFLYAEPDHRCFWQDEDGHDHYQRCDSKTGNTCSYSVWSDYGYDIPVRKQDCEDEPMNLADRLAIPRPAIVFTADGRPRVLQGNIAWADGKLTNGTLLDPRAHISADQSANYSQNGEDPEAVDLTLNELKKELDAEWKDSDQRSMPAHEPMWVVTLVNEQVSRLMDRELRNRLPIYPGNFYP